MDFSNNLFNWLILVAIIAWGCSQLLPPMFKSRRENIQSALDEAKNAREEGAKFLQEQEQRVANAKQEAEQILVEARQVAERMKEQMAEQTKKDAVDLEHKIEQQISTHRQMVITELRSSAATVAVRLAEASLPGAITDKVKQGLQDRFISQLDSIGGGTK